MTANRLVQGQSVKGQGHSVRNRQHGFTAKFVGLSYLFNLSGGRFHGHVAPNMVARRKYTRRPKTIFSNQNNDKPRTSGAMSFGLRDAVLSQLHSF